MSIFTKAQLAILAIFHALFLLLPLIFTSVNDELFEFNKLLIVYVGAIGISCIWALTSIAHRKILFVRTPFDIPILLFLTSQIASTVFSIDKHTSLYGYYTRFNGGLLSTIAYIILFYAASIFIQKKHIRSLCISLLTGAVFATLYAFPEHFGHSPSCLLLTGTFDVACWVQDVQSRVFGTFGQPNWLAAYLIVILPIILAIQTEQQKKKSAQTQTLKRTVDNTTTPVHTFSLSHVVTQTLLWMLCLSVLLFTGSRSGLLGAFTALCTGAILFLLYVATHRNQIVIMQQVRSLYIPIVIQALISVVIVFLFGSSTIGAIAKMKSVFASKPEQVATKTAQPSGGTQLEVGGSDSGKIRKVVWEGALKVWKRYPLFGSGVETFGYSYFGDRPKEHNLLTEWDFLYNKAHNEFLNFLATTGIVGLLSYLCVLTAFIVYPLYCVFIQKRTDPLSLPDVLLILAIASGLNGLSVSNFFGFSTVVVSFLLFVLPALSYVLIAKNVDFPEVHHIKLTTDQWVIGMGVSIISIVLLSFVWRMWKADVLYAQSKAYYSQSDIGSSIQALTKAINLFPTEAVYHDELSYVAAQGAYTLAESGNSTASGKLAQFAVDESNITLALNSVHTNFYKTRTRIFLLLAQIDSSFYAQAIQTLQETRQLSPTDPKLLYNLALIAKEQNDTKKYVAYLEETLALRPIDEQARFAYAQYFESTKDFKKAQEQYEYMLQFINPENILVKERLASVSGTKK